MLGAVFERFVENSPISVMSHGLLGDRQTFRSRQGLRGPAKKGDRRAHLRLVREIPALSKGYEYRTDTSEAMIYAVMIHLMVQRIAAKTPFSGN